MSGEVTRVALAEKLAALAALPPGSIALLTLRASAVEERDPVRVREVLGRCAGELTKPHREHRAAQGMLERLPRAEVGRERERADHLGRAKRALGRGRCVRDCHGIVSRHPVTL